jgi:putative endonuclease
MEFPLFTGRLSAGSENTLPSKQEEGKKGEEKALAVLKKEGYKIIEKNYRNPLGEIDIIAEEGGYLVFVEVKKRNTARFGGPFSAVDEKKKRHIIGSAMFYLKDHKCFDRKVRFDVVGIDAGGVRIVKHAFVVENRANE